MIAEQDQLSAEPSDLESVAYDKHLVGGSGMTDQVRRAISASGQSGSNAVRDAEALDDLAALVRKEVHDKMQRAAQQASEHGDEGATMTGTERPAAAAVVDVPTAAAMLGIGRTLAYQLVRTGQWPTPLIRVGRLIKVPTRPLLEYVDGGARDGAQTVRLQRYNADLAVQRRARIDGSRTATAPNR